jgi:hypothetical protein
MRAASARATVRAVNLSIHSGTVVCPQQSSTVEAQACGVCVAFRGTGRANADVVCVPPAGAAGGDATLWALFLTPKS